MLQNATSRNISNRRYKNTVEILFNEFHDSFVKIRNTDILLKENSIRYLLQNRKCTHKF